jgi:hypothetical protein
MPHATQAECMSIMLDSHPHNTPNSFTSRALMGGMPLHSMGDPWLCVLQEHMAWLDCQGHAWLGHLHEGGCTLLHHAL